MTRRSSATTARDEARAPRLRSATIAASVLALTTVLAGACASSPSTTAAGSPATVLSTGSSSAATTGSSPAPAVPDAAATMRTKRYCEVLLVKVVEGQANADVYNSYPLNDCPQDQWSKLDPKAIAAAEGSTLAVLNGPRFWLMDRVEKEGGTAGLPKKDFGGIEMYRQASVAVGPLADAAKPYTAHEVNRSTVFTFDAGRTVYELRGPDGGTYVMQTWSQQKDPTLTEADLAGLGARLQLPPGWTYRARTLDAPLRVVTTTTAAKVLQDDLGNSYSQVAV